jgi:CheY-like chemotaxis protein
MRLDFNVLWVEDNQDRVQSQRERVELLIRKDGFRLRVQFADSVASATSYLSNDIYGDHVDLILMDYDLGPGMKGDDGLAAVRDLFPYKDIIFYSGMSQAELLRMANAKDVQGVFTSHRDALPDIVEGVFENLVRKVLDIDHSRGIVMGATSDIDQAVNDALLILFDQCDDTQKALAIAAVTKRMATKRKDFDEAAAKIEALNHLAELLEHHGIYTSDDRLRLLRKMLKLLQMHPEHGEMLDAYTSRVGTPRNDLAHIRVVAEGFSRKLFDRHQRELTSEDMRKLRLALLEYQALFDQMFPAPQG